MKIYKKVLLTFILSFMSLSLFSQEMDKKQNAVESDSVFGHFLMVNSADTTRKFKLRDNGAYNITVVEYPKDSVSIEKIYYINGNIRELYATKLEFDIRNESIEHNFKDSSCINSQHDYSSFYYSKLEKPRTINLKDLKYIDYSSPTRSVIHSIGVSTMILSAVTTLVIAPLFNIDFKTVAANTKGSAEYHDPVNSKGYINTVKVGLIGFAFGFPISYFSRTKQYNLTSSKKKNDRDFWYLEKESQK